MSIGPHKLEYEVLQGWEQLPEGWSFVEVAGVAVDSQDRVYVFNRGEHPVMVFDKEGRFLNAWGEGLFSNAHGIFIDRDDRLWLADNGDHTVRVCTPDGEVTQTLGEPNVGAETGFVMGATPVQHSAGPFNMVTNAVVAPDGSVYVADGYGNARVHHFSAEGELLHSWGQPGSGPGEFNLPHGIAVSRDGRVYVADRENSRIQIFTLAGEYLTEWTWVGRPDDLFFDDQENLYIAELGWAVPVPERPHFLFMRDAPPGHDPIGRVTVCDPDGHVISRFGSGGHPTLPGNFIAPHGICADSRGDLYVGEVVKASGAVDLFAPLTCHSFQKFVRGG